MVFSPLLLNKSAAIPNKRLNVVFFMMFLTVFAILVYTFFTTEGGTVKMYNKPQLSFSLSTDSIENALDYNREADPLWALHSENWHEQSVPKKRFPPFTKFWERFSNSFLTTTDCAAGKNFEECLDLFETGNPNSPFDIETALKNQYITFGSNATLPGASPRPLNSDELMVDTYFNVFTQAYSYNISYTYALDAAPTIWFGFNSNIPLYGNSTNTRTVVLGSDGLPDHTFEPGSAIIIRLPKLLQLARGNRASSQAFIPKTRSYGTSMGSAERFPSWVWENGCLLYMVVNCFSSDRDIRRKIGIRAVKGHDNHVWDFGASPDKPICLLDVRMADTKAFNWRVRTQKPGITVRENVVNLRVIGKVGHSFFRVISANAIFLFITSSMVMLSLPKKAIALIALHCLGHLSNIYRSILIQAVDIRECCAKAVLQLVSHSVCFVELADRLGPDGQDYGGISRSRMFERVRAVVRHRRDVLDTDEVAKLAGFTFCLATCPPEQPMQQRQGFLMLLKSFLTTKNGAKKSEQNGTKSSEQDESPSIDIDNFCRATGSPYLSIDAIVQLFDRNRRYGIGERMFMPPDLYQWIHGSEPRSLPSSEEASGADPMQVRIPLERKKSNVESLLISQELAQNSHNRQDASVQTPGLKGMLQSMSTMSEQLDIMRANIEELKLELHNERELRNVSESALRQEVERAMQANADEVFMKMARIGRTDSDQKDMLSQMRTELSHNLELTAPDSHSKMDLVHLREDLDRLRHDLGSHCAQIKQQAAVEARNAAQEVLSLHWQNQEAKLVVKSHQQRAKSEKLMASEPTGAFEEKAEKLKASEPTGKERCRGRDTQPGLDQRTVADVDTYGRSVKAAQAEAKPKVRVAAVVNGTETQQNRTASRASQGSASSCFSRSTNECLDSWLYLPASTWSKQNAESLQL